MGSAISPVLNEGEPQPRLAVLTCILEPVIDVADQKGGLFDLNLEELSQPSQLRQGTGGGGRLQGMLLGQVTVRFGRELLNIERQDEEVDGVECTAGSRRAEVHMRVVTEDHAPGCVFRVKLPGDSGAVVEEGREILQRDGPP